MNELTLSTDINQIEFEIQHYKQVAGQSIWEIGRRLNHVKEHDLVHGEFIEWVEEQGITYREANRMMKVASELPNMTNWSHLSSRALYLIATLPTEEKEQQIERIESGEHIPIKEIEELKRQLKSKDELIESLGDTMHDFEQYSKRLESENEQLKNRQPEVVEKVVEPSDYRSLKSNNEDLKLQLDEASRQLDRLYNERQEHEEKSVKYDQLTEAINDMQGKMNRTQKLIATQKQVYELVDLSKELLAKIVPIPYLINADYVRENEVAKRELNNVATQTQKFLDNLNGVLKESEIIEGEIING